MPLSPWALIDVRDEAAVRMAEEILAYPLPADPAEQEADFLELLTQFRDRCHLAAAPWPLATKAAVLHLTADQIEAAQERVAIMTADGIPKLTAEALALGLPVPRPRARVGATVEVVDAH